MTPINSCEAFCTVMDCATPEMMQEIANMRELSLEELENEISRIHQALAVCFSGVGFSGIATAGCYWGGVATKITMGFGLATSLTGIFSLAALCGAVVAFQKAANENIENNSLAGRRLTVRNHTD